MIQIEIELHGIEVEQRDPELVGGSDSDLSSVAEAVCDQMWDEMGALPVNGFERSHEIVLGNDPVLNQPTRQAA